MILEGDCRQTLKTLAAESVSSIVTDPPYEIGFMGKSWDGYGVANDPTLWAECYRVLKPGGHVLAFGATRTYHRMACAIEDAGFEIRDSIHWVYGSGFPKSHNVSKAIDKAAGLTRGRIPYENGILSGANNYGGGNSKHSPKGSTKSDDVALTDESQQWSGWGTALKPAHEPIVMARKPFAGTVAANVMEYGTGALNIDATRVANMGAPIQRITGTAILGGVSDGYDRPWKHDSEAVAARQERADAAIDKANELARWPANVLLTHSTECGLECAPDCPALEIDQQAETASRYFAQPEWSPGDYLASVYTPKAGRRERNAGLDGMAEVREHDGRTDGNPGGDNPANRTNTPKQNYHPTVKPVALMRYLIRLVTPPGGLVLDPFLGSGTTAVAAILEGFNWIGCELTAEYLPIIEARTLNAARDYPALNTIQNADNSTQSQLGLFGELPL